MGCGASCNKYSCYRIRMLHRVGVASAHVMFHCKLSIPRLQRYSYIPFSSLLCHRHKGGAGREVLVSLQRFKNAQINQNHYLSRSMSYWTSYEKEREKYEEKKLELELDRPIDTYSSIFVGNLPLTFTEEDLLAMAKSRGVPQGDLKKCRIVLSLKTCTSRGFGYLDFHTEEQARACLPLFFHRMTIDDKDIKFDLEKPRPKLARDSEYDRMTTRMARANDKGSRNNIKEENNKSERNKNNINVKNEIKTKDKNLNSVSHTSDHNSPLTSIYVGNLPFTFTEDDLLALAKSRDVPLSTMKSYRIVVTAKSCASRGFGYLDFHTEEQARACLPLFFHRMTIDDNDIKFNLASFDKEQHALRNMASAVQKYTLFVGNLSFDVDDQMLKQHIVEQMRVARENGNGSASSTVNQFQEPFLIVRSRKRELEGGEEGRSRQVAKGYAFVQFLDARSMKEAFEAIKFTELHGRPLNVRLHTKMNPTPLYKSNCSSENNINSNSNNSNAIENADWIINNAAEDVHRFLDNKTIQNSLHISNLDFHATHEEILEEIVEVLGPGRVQRLRLSVSNVTARNKGKGFIDFHSTASASDAMGELIGLTIRDRPIEVREAYNEALGMGVGVADTQTEASAYHEQGLDTSYDRIHESTSMTDTDYGEGKGKDTVGGRSANKVFFD